jgi:beta-N-acetylhexosaminidase
VVEVTGRVLAVGIAGPTLDAATRRALVTLRPGAVVLLGRNVDDPHQLRELVAGLHRLPSRPLVAIDQEGGRVTRLGPPFTRFPSAAAVGRAGAAAARAVGEAIARELGSVGIDVDLAPVLDLGQSTGDSVGGDRIFATEPAAVAELGLAFATGIQAGGALPCGKHFPGHGATATDSHVTRPVISHSRDELMARDLVPFRAATRAGMPMLMTAHVLYPALDAERVATLSPAIAGDLLRRELGFHGVLWSDDLMMRAVSVDRRPAEAAVAALAAGVDGVLICHDLDEALRAAKELRDAADGDPGFAARLGEAAARIAALAALRRRRTRPLALPAAAHAELAERVRAMAAAGSAC